MFQPLPAGNVGCVINFLLCAYNNETLIYTSDTGEEYGCEYREKPMSIEDNAKINDQSPITNKIIKDNQLLIVRDGKLFNAQGAQVK